MSADQNADQVMLHLNEIMNSISECALNIDVAMEGGEGNPYYSDAEYESQEEASYPPIEEEAASIDNTVVDSNDGGGVMDGECEAEEESIGFETIYFNPPDS